jgi:hypothetical protein
MRKNFFVPAACAALALACGTTTTVLTPTVDLGTMVAQTLAAHPSVAAVTQAATSTLAPSQPEPDTPAPPPATDTSAPVPPTDTPAPTLEENAPNPLPAMNTGIILNNGECFNFDNGQVTVPDAQCDVWLAESALFRQMNGAQLSGYVTQEPPTRSHCAAGRYESGDLAVQTDLYMCFITNQGNVGFIVVRGYRGAVPFTGIVLDYWVFR